MSQAFYITDTLCKMAPLAFCSSLDTILSTLLPVVLIVSVLQCPSLRPKMRNILQVPAQTPELPCPHGHRMYNIPWASCLLHACICMSVTSWILNIHRTGQGPGLFLRDTYGEDWLSSWAILSFISGPHLAFNSTRLLSWAPSSQVRDRYISRYTCGKKFLSQIYECLSEITRMVWMWFYTWYARSSWLRS